MVGKSGSSETLVGVDKVKGGKNARRRNAKKEKKHLSKGDSGQQKVKVQASEFAKYAIKQEKNVVKAENVEVEYVIQEKPDLENDDPSLEEFSRVFQRFVPTEEEADEYQYDEVPMDGPDADVGGKDEDGNEDADSEEQRISRKKRRLLSRLTVAELKQIVPFPELVEMHDANASDPRTLLRLKSHRHTVPVPVHWSQRRKYLQAKRGQEKSSYELPEFVARTGIGEMRQTVADEDDKKSLKARQRERLQPKMGKLNLDYQMLHDAFFKYQTKPKLGSHGDMYYEGKEYEVTIKTRRPGDLSKSLRDALGMTELTHPPPWLVHMQRFGPPPSYPNLKIPGLNSPLPAGAQWGYHAGGWGKPPLNELGQPLYGDVYGAISESQYISTRPSDVPEEPTDRYWGEIDDADEDIGGHVDDEEDEEDEEVKEDMESGGDGEGDGEGDESSRGGRSDCVSSEQNADDGFTTTAAAASKAVEPEHFELRKKRRTAESGGGGEGQYAGGGIEVALDPSELATLDEATLNKKYSKELESRNRTSEYADILDAGTADRERRRRRTMEEKSAKRIRND